MRTGFEVHCARSDGLACASGSNGDQRGSNCARGDDMFVHEVFYLEYRRWRVLEDRLAKRR